MLKKKTSSLVNMSYTQHTCFGLLNKSKGRGLPGLSSVLQILVSSRSGHAAPASFASLITSRDLRLVPPPQVTLQSPHADQSPTLQSTEDQQFSKYMMMKIKKVKKARMGKPQCICPTASNRQPCSQLEI